MIAFPHMARLIDPAWDIKASNICLVQTRGKGNFKKYAKFFKRFGVPILLIGDLDLLIQDYDKIGASPTADGLRTELFRALDAIIDAENKLPDPKWILLRDEIQRERGKRLYETLLVARKESDINKMTDIIGEIMLFERTEPKLVIMKDLARADIQALKRKLLGQLRAENVIILEKGDIEAYYPSAIAGSVDKVKRANDFCDLVNNLNDLEPLSEDIPYEGRTEKELKVICAAIMGEQINPIVSSL